MVIGFLGALETLGCASEAKQGYFTVVNMLHYISLAWICPAGTNSIVSLLRRFRNGGLPSLHFARLVDPCEVTQAPASREYSVNITSPEFLRSTFGARLLHRREVGHLTLKHVATLQLVQVFACI